MKKLKLSFTVLGLLSLLALLTGCSTVKVQDSWQDTAAIDLQSKKMIVVSVTDDDTSRLRFEKDLVNELNNNGYTSKESYTKFPEIAPGKKVQGKKLEELKQKLRNDGVELVMVNVVKDEKHYTKTTTNSSSVYMGSPHFYGHYHRGFYGYYGSMYVGPTTSTTTQNTKYILETIIYDLSKSEENQLQSVITTEIDNPKTIGSTSKDFSKTIVKELIRNNPPS